MNQPSIQKLKKHKKHHPLKYEKHKKRESETATNYIDTRLSKASKVQTSTKLD